MTTMKEYMELDKSVILNTDEFAVSITLSNGSVIKGIVKYGEVMGSFDLGGQAAMATVRVAVSDFPNPTRYDTITISSVEWRIESHDSGDHVYWMLTVSRDRRIS